MDKEIIKDAFRKKEESENTLDGLANWIEVAFRIELKEKHMFSNGNLLITHNIHIDSENIWLENGQLKFYPYTTFRGEMDYVLNDPFILSLEEFENLSQLDFLNKFIVHYKNGVDTKIKREKEKHENEERKQYELLRKKFQ